MYRSKVSITYSSTPMKLLDKYKAFLLVFFHPFASPPLNFTYKSPTLNHPFFNVWILAIRLLSKKEQKKIMQIINLGKGKGK
jgi:hypothetical protein